MKRIPALVAASVLLLAGCTAAADGADGGAPGSNSTIGSSAEAPAGVGPAEGTTYTGLAVAYDTICALTSAGDVWCLPDYPELGLVDQAPTQIEKPADISITSIDLGKTTEGGALGCGLASDGSAWCWYPKGTPRGNRYDGGAAFHPVAMPPGTTFSTLSVGSEHACGLDPDGAVWCWGDNYYGQLGDGTSGYESGEATYRLHPRRVVTDAAAPFISVTADEGETCALAEDQSIWCWGYIGDGGQGSEAWPDPVAIELPSQETDFVALDARCALTAHGTAWCWDGVFQGLAGDGLQPEERPTLREIELPRGLTITSLSGCALADDGSVWCWGSSTSPTSEAALVPAPPGVSLQAIASGGTRACGIATDQSIWCWQLPLPSEPDRVKGL